MTKWLSKANASFNSIHPSPTAGRNSVGVDEPKWINCKQCGYAFDTTKHPKGNPLGNITTTAVSGGTNVDEPIVNGGCPFCGSSNY